MSFITIDQRKLHYFQQGAGKTVLWIHGFPLTGEMWKWQLDLPGVLHLLPDLAGFGQSDAFPDPAEPSMARYGSDLLALLDELEIGSAILAGCSMGGYVAFDILRSAPERVDAVILANTRETEDSPSSRNARAETIRATEEAGDVSDLANDMIPKLLGPGSQSDQSMIELVSGMIQASSIAGVVFALGAMARRPDSSDVLRSFSKPALILAGEHDQLIPREDAERMAHLLPQAKLTVIPGTGHLPAIEEPALFNDAISEFISDHDLSN
ncbi:MAG: alpha/beta hydrolase [Acidobacteria bacterium]|nr:alpha/beta hydrolase [Acidobacteriota bacterium]